MLLIFLAAVLVVAGIYSLLSDLFLRDRSRFSERVDEEFRSRQREHVQKSALFKSLSTLAAEGEAADAAEPTVRRRFEAMVEQSGLHITPRRLLTIALAVGLALAALAMLISKSLLGGGAAFLSGAGVPLLYVQRKRKARMENLLSQLPDAFDLMSRVIRAGQTMSQAMRAVADEFQPPLAAEFAYCYEQQNLGLSPEIALRDLA